MVVSDDDATGAAQKAPGEIRGSVATAKARRSVSAMLSGGQDKQEVLAAIRKRLCVLAKEIAEKRGRSASSARSSSSSTSEINLVDADTVKARKRLCDFAEQIAESKGVYSTSSSSTSRRLSSATEIAESDKADTKSAGLGPAAEARIVRELRDVKVGQHWDKKLGDEYDVLVPANEERLKAQMLRSLANLFGIDCRSFSRARGRLAPGAKRLPGVLKSAEFVLGLPNVKLQAEEKTFWQRCDICGCQARVPYARCNFCGDQPSYHHGRCCFRNPGRPATEDTDRPLPTAVPQQDPQRHLWRGCPDDCEREGYVGICLPCEDFELAPEDAKPEARESRCDLRCQYFYEDGRQCELGCFLTLAHHSQLGYYHLCEQHYGCVTDDEDEEHAVLWCESTLAHAVSRTRSCATCRFVSGGRETQWHTREPCLCGDRG